MIFYKKQPRKNELLLYFNVQSKNLLMSVKYNFKKLLISKIYFKQVDDETFEEVYKSTRRNIPMLFVRGDGVILVAPPMRGGAM